MSTNRLRARLAAGDVALGGWCSTGSALVAELLSRAGFDYVCVDCQHGLAGGEALPALLGVHDATAVARVPSNDAGWIGRALDAGAEAVIVPLVEDAAAAAAAVAAARYAPAGTRSYGTNRARLQGEPAVVNAEVMCVVMIETRAGVERAAEICATPGVDGVYLGPTDLAVDAGLVPGVTHDAVETAIERVRLACADAGVVAAIHAASGEEARRRVEQGFQMVTVTTDVAVLRAGLAAALDTARGA